MVTYHVRDVDAVLHLSFCAEAAWILRTYTSSSCLLRGPRSFGDDLVFSIDILILGLGREAVSPSENQPLSRRG